MSIDDHDAVADLWQRCEGLGIIESRSELQRFLERNPGMSLVACDGQGLVGAVMCGHDGRRGYLYHLGVAPGCRRHGIARELVNRCLDALAEIGLQRCSIHVYGMNDEGARFWRQIGWRERTDLIVFAHDLPRIANETT